MAITLRYWKLNIKPENLSKIKSTVLQSGWNGLIAAVQTFTFVFRLVSKASSASSCLKDQANVDLQASKTKECVSAQFLFSADSIWQIVVNKICLIALGWAVGGLEIRNLNFHLLFRSKLGPAVLFTNPLTENPLGDHTRSANANLLTPLVD